MVKELKISGFKCFKDVRLELSNLSLFTGVNSAGKSSAIGNFTIITTTTKMKAVH